MLGDSAVGKSKLVERFLMDGYQPQQLSTFALTLFRYEFKHPDGRLVLWTFGTQPGRNASTICTLLTSTRHTRAC